MPASPIPFSTDRSQTGAYEMNTTDTTGTTMHELMAALYPLCRSITGDGVRRDACDPAAPTFRSQIHEVPSGTPVFDWTVPKEWNIRDAYVKDAQGRRVIDFQESNLHVVSYSVPVKRRLSLAELRKHLFSLPDRPDWIPYRTSYYNETWGFCLSHRQLEALPDGEYEVCIDATLEDGQPDLRRVRHSRRIERRGA